LDLGDEAGMQAGTTSDMGCLPSAREALAHAPAWSGCDAGAGLDVRAGAQAVMTFDLGCPAGDAAWAPYSATVFAAAGEDGKVRVWDLARDARAPMCEQRVAAHAALTRLAFSPTRPVLLIGDEGCVRPGPRTHPYHDSLSADGRSAAARGGCDWCGSSATPAWLPGAARAPAACVRIHSLMPDSMHASGGQVWASRMHASSCHACLRRACARSPARRAAGATAPPPHWRPLS